MSKSECRFDLDKVRAGLREPSRWTIHYVDCTGSTNDDALTAPRVGDSDRSVYIAGYQTAGRGARGRFWQAPPDKAILMSVLLTPQHMPSPTALTMVSVLAMVEGLRLATGLEVQIKWPNDAVINDRKIGGVLVEIAKSAVVIGMGINMNFPASIITSPDYPATSVQDELGRGMAREEVIAQILNVLDSLSTQILANTSSLDDRWRQLSSILNRKVLVETESKVFDGTVVGFGQNGQLVLREPNGNERSFIAGRVRLTQQDND